MGYLLKEALKALCSVNQWCYAVFWKIGCQNPKLLIWEECYYESLPSPNAPALNSYQKGVQVLDRVHFLIDKMMMLNQVNVVGQGLVGRAAFTGNHQWIVSGNCNEFTHPAEVLNEAGLQFSAGMQTIAVIPVIPHGVVQFGSTSAILENVGFVHDVRSLIIRLGCVPNAFMSGDYNAKGDCILDLPIADVAVNPNNLRAHPTQLNSCNLVAGSFNVQNNTSDYAGLVNQTSGSLLTQFQDNLQVSGSAFEVANMTQESSNSHLITAGTGGHLNQDSLMNQLTPNIPGPGISCPESSVSRSHSGHQVTVNGFASNISSTKKEIDSGISGQYGYSFQTAAHANKGFHDYDLSMENLVNLLKTDSQNTLNTFPKNQEHMSTGVFTPNDSRVRSQVPASNVPVGGESFFHSSDGNDLFDVLGTDLKNKLLNSNDKKLPIVFDASSKNVIKDSPKSMNLQNARSGLYSDFGRGSETQSGVFSSFGCDHLLEAMISGVNSSSKQSSDDNTSCWTTASKISSSSVPSTPGSNPPLSGLFTMTDSIQQRLLGFSKPVVRLSEPSGLSVGSASIKSDGANCSMSSSTYGSQISSWMEQGPTTSVSTANSKKTDEGGKTNRKRLKPGENPRPRPKDRQMIQDRVKELREIVPNGSKCSIDALLERTIKHMLFLQSVNKHADKLKQTVESKLDKKGGMLKDNFEGGATWAFELGSQSMVCPIVVEDLNAPRQFLIEMLCEERGYFLEIADIVRGLGLTILKGVMEARRDKIWARFAVEADRDVTRMDVFISLVHLLEKTLQGNTTLDNSASDENTIGYPASKTAEQQMIGSIVCGEPSTM